VLSELDLEVAPPQGLGQEVGLQGERVASPLEGDRIEWASRSTVHSARQRGAAPGGNEAQEPALREVDYEHALAPANDVRRGVPDALQDHDAKGFGRARPLRRAPE
jgi:hypothetical protein